MEIIALRVALGVGLFLAFAWFARKDRHGEGSLRDGIKVVSYTMGVILGVFAGFAVIVLAIGFVMLGPDLFDTMTEPDEAQSCEAE